MTTLTVAMFFGAFTLNAQSLQIIPKAGNSLSKINIKGYDGEKFKGGFQGGVALNIAVGTSRFSVQPEINFTNKGMAYYIVDGITTEEFNINYLELPVLLKFNLGLAYINAGPSIALKLGNQKYPVAEFGSLKKIDFGMQFGGGLAIPVGMGKFIVDVRYYHGLMNISEFEGAEIKTRGIITTVGYAVPLGR
ncbi:porin family protein [Paenimyroides ummariense]|nr:porin family protein [Paenimyroides ummariense]